MAKHDIIQIMDVDEFSKIVQPGAKNSRMTPFINDLIELRKAGYTLKQVQEFLSKNGVATSLSNLARFLKRQEPTPKTQQRNKGNQARASPQTNRPAVTEVEEAPVVGSHKPSDLDKVIGSKVDMDALAKYAKGMKK